MEGLFGLFGQDETDPYTNTGLFGLFNEGQAARMQMAAQILNATANNTPINTANSMIALGQMEQKNKLDKQRRDMINRYADKIEASNPGLAEAMRADPAIFTTYMDKKIANDMDPSLQFYREIMGGGQSAPAAPVSGAPVTTAPVAGAPQPAPSQAPAVQDQATAQATAQQAVTREGQQQPDPFLQRLSNASGIPDLRPQEARMLALAARGGQAGFANMINTILDNRRAEFTQRQAVEQQDRQAQAAAQMATMLEEQGNPALAQIVRDTPEVMQMIGPALFSNKINEQNTRAGVEYLRQADPQGQYPDALYGQPDVVKQLLNKRFEMTNDPLARALSPLMGGPGAPAPAAPATGPATDARDATPGTPVPDAPAPATDGAPDAAPDMAATVARYVGVDPSEVTPEMVERIQSAGTPELMRKEIDEIQTEIREDNKRREDAEAAAKQSDRDLEQKTIDNAKDLSTWYEKKNEPIQKVLQAGEQVQGMFDDNSIDQAEQMRLLYTYITALDPESVVREGEVALARQLENLQQMIQRQLERVDGKYTLLSPEIARQIGGDVLKLAELANQRKYLLDQRLESRANRQGVPMEMIIGEEPTMEGYEPRFNSNLPTPGIDSGQDLTPMPGD